MSVKQWLIKRAKRYIEVNEAVRIPTDQQKVNQEKFIKACSALANPQGSLQDYVKQFNEVFNSALRKEVKIFDEGLMTEAGVEFEDPVTGRKQLSRIKSADWLQWDGTGKEVTRLKLGYDKECREAYRQKVTGNFDRLMKEANTGFDSNNIDWSQLTTQNSTIRQNLPYPPGPFTKQQYLQDFWKMNALAFQAANYAGLAKCTVNTKVNFTIGGGVKIDFEDTQIQKDWDEFEDRKQWYLFHGRLRAARHKYGEFFVQPMLDSKKRLDVRVVDNSTIWEIITSPEDIEDVKGYWVQFPTQYQLFGVGAKGEKVPLQEYIVRNMPPDSLIGLKANVDENEKRGRSDLLPGLAILAYNDDFIRAKVLRAIMESSYVWDVEVQTGDSTDVDREAGKETNFPPPGSSYFHNAGIKRTLSGFSGAASSGISGVGEEIINQYSLAVEVPKEFFGSAGHTNKASALTATAPFTKSIQFYQKEDETFLRRFIKWWLVASGRPANSKFEVIYPEIAPADMDKKVQTIVLAQTNGYLAKETAATLTAKEINYTTFDWQAEKAKIDAEKKEEMNSDPVMGILPNQHKPSSGLPPLPAMPGKGLNPQGAGPGTGPPSSDDALPGSGMQ